MTARNFAEDGAVGANSNGDFGSGGGNFGQAATGSFTTDSGGGMTLPATGISGGDSGYNPAGVTAGASGLAGIDQSGHLNAAGTTMPDITHGATASGLPGLGAYAGGGFNRSAAGLAFAEGGAIPDADDDAGSEPDNDQDDNAADPQGSATGASMQRSIDAAMKTVQNALSYGRQLHGLGGGQQEAAAMPTIPGTQSESGQPRPRPAPGPGPQVPFGKRADMGMDDGSDQTAAMPSVPFSETPRPQPMPGPLPPTSNPFGKRGQQADAGSDAAPDAAIEEDA